ncbi:hypothetical protein [Microbacterium sp. 2FI]|uniref:hypothetical protein n=1 Tax=Microbacterium sp. 2FI TaxID=2502193 RepID=UPI0010F8CC36|nr:hypothetical protein [Microbacterium sp. 2FI]
MEGPSPPSDAQRELSELRARAYGPGPGIADDPAALARLRELEGTSDASADARAGGRADDAVADLEPVPAPSLPVPETVAAPDTPWRSLWRRATATRARRAAWGLACVVVVGSAVTVALLLMTVRPHPDATLQPTDASPNDAVIRMVASTAGEWEADVSTLRAYEPYLGMDLWYATNAWGSRCLFALQVARTIISEAHCAPAEAELFIDVSSWGDDFDQLPVDGVARIVMRDDELDVFVYDVPGAD